MNSPRPACMTGGDEKPLSVVLCGAHPHDEDFDHAWAGEDYATLEEARAVFNAPCPIAAMSQGCDHPARFISSNINCTPYVWLLGPADQIPNGEEIRTMPNSAKILKRMAKEAEEDQRAWACEYAHQAGMMGGCEAYNHVMGY